jgi:7,8-dihydropterin-6-yl-methyl-4-(beta-D-ribofuranosyl)aminobenzene 5'-phosphate synthase
MAMNLSRARRAVLSGSCLMALAALFAAPGGGEEAPMLDREAAVMAAGDVTITEIYNNIVYEEGMISSWGFSCAVRLPGCTILFDTGGEGNVLLDNMEAAGIEPSSIDIIFLSHGHGDHIGGLRDFLEQNGEVTVYSPASFGDEYREILSGFGIEPIDVTGPIEICPGAWSTGVLDKGIPEQSLVLSTDRGAVIVTGCAHPGIADITARASEIAKRDPLLVMGGFHLGQAGGEELGRIFESLEGLGVRYVSPSHCTGMIAIAAFRAAFEGRFVEGGAGKIHEIGKLR